MTTVARLRPNAKDEFTSSLGMIIALGSWAMMFGALFMIYVGLRAKTVMWPPAGVPAFPMAVPALGTVVLLVSSGTLEYGLRALGRGERNKLPGALLATIVLGALFVGIQLHVYQRLLEQGLTPRTGTYGAIFYGLTGLHAVHVAAGLVVLFVLFVRSLYGVYTEHNKVRVRIGAMFWHFIDVVWVLMFVSIYLV